MRMLRNNIGFLAAFFVMILGNASLAGIKDTSLSKKVTVIPGAEYAAGGLHKFFFGYNWRDLWSTPIEVEVLDINSFKGGITPFEEGGGQQTTSLKFKDKEGNEYKFRSVNKDPSAILPEDLRNTFVDCVVEDQMSTANPMGPIIAGPFHKALGILHAQPSLYIMPDDPKLGEYREKFKNMLGTFEEHPDEDENDTRGFAGSKKVVGTFKLFERMEEDNDNRVDAEKYLTARLLDLFIGDWDRHTDQYRWARYEEGDTNMWQPIPRDRDQAFAKFNGIGPWIVSKIVKHFEGFSDKIMHVDNYVHSGRFIDRRFLPQLTKAEWDSVAHFVIESLTDSVIRSAVKRMPPSMFEKEGEKLIADLISRKKTIKDASDKYYNLMNEVVEIRGSDKDEYAEVIRLNDSEVSVKLFDLDDEENYNKNEPFFFKIFDKKITDEIRIYLLGGEDIAEVKGKVKSSIDVIISGGKGKNKLTDKSVVEGYFLDITPIPQAEERTYFYTYDDNSEIIKSSSTEAAHEEEKEYETELEEYEPEMPTWGSSLGFSGILRADSDLGLSIGTGPVIIKHGYNRHPYQYKIGLAGEYAFGPNKFRIDFLGDFPVKYSDKRVLFNAAYSQIEIINFFGFGNNFNKIDSFQNKSYRVDHEEIIFNALLKIPVLNSFNFLSGLGVKYAHTDPSTFNAYPLLQNEHLLYKIFSGIELDLRNDEIIPDSGYYFIFEGVYHPRYKDDQMDFGKIRSMAKAFFPFKLLGRSSFALRIGGEKNIGNFPFFEAAFIGGGDRVRGFKRELLAGNAALYGNAELRLALTKIKLLIPFTLGISLFADIGRVYAEGENSELWHKAVGAGLLISVIKQELSFGVYLTRPQRELQFYLTTGYPF